ncbi:hypothetical protein PoB_000617600 [Plakobranchus ocellatus]|uniref:Uncharacterized protein n=1 Tax=Plakobranchus ocellatus TaxID=259542 RepID=A0AAV3XXI1_9GAST|nr:hypothetical protein PoB_000617600 [Plakobranchus ocellatus]
MEGCSKDGTGHGKSTEKTVEKTGRTSHVRKSCRSRKKSKRALDGADYDAGEVPDVPTKKKKKGGKRIKIKKSRKDVSESGRPFVCSLCETKCSNPSKIKGKNGPVYKEKDGRSLQLCVDCAIAINHTENKGPSQEQRQQFEEEGRQFGQHLANYLGDGEATRLYCSFYATRQCGCIQNFISGVSHSKRKKCTFSDPDIPSLLPEECMDPPDDKADKAQRATYLLQLLKESKNRKKVQRTKRSRTSSNQSVSSVRSVDSQSGGETDTGSTSNAVTNQQGELDPSTVSQKRLENFILVHRAKLKKIGICERGCQRVLCYSNNFLHKKSVFGKEARLQRTKGRAALGQLDPVEDLPGITCCEKLCVKFAELKPGKVAQWRQQAQQSQRESWRVISEMLASRHITGGPQHACCRFISLVTGCCLATVRKVYAETLLSKGQMVEREHGLRFHWRRQKQSLSESSTTDPVKPESRKKQKTEIPHSSASLSSPSSCGSNDPQKTVILVTGPQRSTCTSQGPSVNLSRLSQTGKHQVFLKQDTSMASAKVVVSSLELPPASQRLLIAPSEIAVNPTPSQPATPSMQVPTTSQFSSPSIPRSQGIRLPSSAHSHFPPLLLSYIQGPSTLATATTTIPTTTVRSSATSEISPSKNTDVDENAPVLPVSHMEMQKQSSFTPSSNSNQAKQSLTSMSPNNYEVKQGNLPLASASTKRHTPLQTDNLGEGQHDQVLNASFSSQSTPSQLMNSPGHGKGPNNKDVEDQAPHLCAEPLSSQIQLTNSSSALVKPLRIVNSVMGSEENCSSSLKQSIHPDDQVMPLTLNKSRPSKRDELAPQMSFSPSLNTPLNQPEQQSNTDHMQSSAKNIHPNSCSPDGEQEANVDHEQSPYEATNRHPRSETELKHLGSKLEACGNFQQNMQQQSSIQPGSQVKLSHVSSDHQPTPSSYQHKQENRNDQMPHDASPQQSQQPQILGQQDFTLITVLENGVQKLYLVPKNPPSSLSSSVLTPSLLPLPPMAIPLDSSLIAQRQPTSLSLPMPASTDGLVCLPKSQTPSETLASGANICSLSSSINTTTTAITESTNAQEPKLISSGGILNKSQASGFLAASEYSLLSSNASRATSPVTSHSLNCVQSQGSKSPGSISAGSLPVSSEPRVSAVVQAETHKRAPFQNYDAGILIQDQSNQANKPRECASGEMILSQPGRSAPPTLTSQIKTFSKSKAYDSVQNLLLESSENVGNRRNRELEFYNRDLQSKQTHSTVSPNEAYNRAVGSSQVQHHNIESQIVPTVNEHAQNRTVPSKPDTQAVAALKPSECSVSEAEGSSSAGPHYVARSEHFGASPSVDGTGITSELIFSQVTCSPSSYVFDALSDSPVSSLHMSHILNDMLSSSRRLSFSSHPASSSHAQITLPSPDIFSKIMFPLTRSGSSSSSRQSPVTLPTTSSYIVSAAASLLSQSQSSVSHCTDDVFPALTTTTSPVCGNEPRKCPTLKCDTHTTPSVFDTQPAPAPCISNQYSFISVNSSQAADLTATTESSQRKLSSAPTIPRIICLPGQQSTNASKTEDQQASHIHRAPQVTCLSEGHTLMHQLEVRPTPASIPTSSLSSGQVLGKHTTAVEKTVRPPGRLLLETLLSSDSSFNEPAAVQALHLKETVKVSEGPSVSANVQPPRAVSANLVPPNTQATGDTNSADGQVGSCALDHTSMRINEPCGTLSSQTGSKTELLRASTNPSGEQPLFARTKIISGARPHVGQFSVSNVSLSNARIPSAGGGLQPVTASSECQIANTSISVPSQQVIASTNASSGKGISPHVPDKHRQNLSCQQNNEFEGLKQQESHQAASNEKTFVSALVNEVQNICSENVTSTAHQCAERNLLISHLTPTSQTSSRGFIPQQSHHTLEENQQGSEACVTVSVQNSPAANWTQAHGIASISQEGNQAQADALPLQLNDNAILKILGFPQELQNFDQSTSGAATSCVMSLPGHGIFGQTVQVNSAGGQRQLVLLPQLPDPKYEPQQQKQAVQQQPLAQNFQSSGGVTQTANVTVKIQDQQVAQPAASSPANLNIFGLTQTTTDRANSKGAVESSVTPITSDDAVWMTVPIAQPQRGNVSAISSKPPKQRRLMPKLAPTAQVAKAQPKSTLMLVPDQSGFPSLPLSQIDPAGLSGLAPGQTIQLRPIVPQADLNSPAGSNPIILNTTQKLLVQALPGQSQELSPAQTGLMLVTIPSGAQGHTQRQSASAPAQDSSKQSKETIKVSSNVYQGLQSTEPSSQQAVSHASISQQADIPLQPLRQAVENHLLKPAQPPVQPNKTSVYLNSSQVEKHPRASLGSAEVASTMSITSQNPLSTSDSSGCQAVPAVVMSPASCPTPSKGTESSAPGHDLDSANVSLLTTSGQGMETTEKLLELPQDHDKSGPNQALVGQELPLATFNLLEKESPQLSRLLQHLGYSKDHKLILANDSSASVILPSVSLQQQQHHHHHQRVAQPNKTGGNGIGSSETSALPSGRRITSINSRAEADVSCEGKHIAPNLTSEFSGSSCPKADLFSALPGAINLNVCTAASQEIPLKPNVAADQQRQKLNSLLPHNEEKAGPGQEGLARVSCQDYEVIDLTDDNHEEIVTSCAERENLASNLLFKELSKSVGEMNALPAACQIAVRSSESGAKPEKLKFIGNHQPHFMQGKQCEDLRFVSYQSLQTPPKFRTAQQTQKQNELQAQETTESTRAFEPSFTAASEQLSLKFSQQLPVSLPVLSALSAGLPQATGVSNMVLLMPLKAPVEQRITGIANADQGQSPSSCLSGPTLQASCSQPSLPTSISVSAVSVPHQDLSQVMCVLNETLAARSQESASFLPGECLTNSSLSTRHTQSGVIEGTTSPRVSFSQTLKTVLSTSNCHSATVQSAPEKHLPSSTSFLSHNLKAVPSTICGVGQTGQMKSSSISRPSSIPICVAATRPVMSPGQAPTFRRTSNTPTDAVGPPNITIVSPSGSSSALLLKFNSAPTLASVLPSSVHHTAPQTSTSTSHTTELRLTTHCATPPSSLRTSATALHTNCESDSTLASGDIEPQGISSLASCTASSHETISCKLPLHSVRPENKSAGSILPSVSSQDNSIEAFKQRLLQNHLNPDLKKSNKSRKRCTKTVNDLLKMSSTQLQAEKTQSGTPENGARDSSKSKDSAAAKMLAAPRDSPGVVLMTKPGCSSQPAGEASSTEVHESGGYDRSVSTSVTGSESVSLTLAEALQARAEAHVRQQQNLQNLHPSSDTIAGPASAPSLLLSRSDDDAVVVGGHLSDPRNDRQMGLQATRHAQAVSDSRKRACELHQAGPSGNVVKARALDMDQLDVRTSGDAHYFRKEQLTSYSNTKEMSSLERGSNLADKPKDIVQSQNPTARYNESKESFTTKGCFPAQHPMLAHILFNNMESLPYLEAPTSVQTVTQQPKKHAQSSGQWLENCYSSAGAEGGVDMMQLPHTIAIKNYTARAPPAYEEATRGAKDHVGKIHPKTSKPLKSDPQGAQQTVSLVRGSKDLEAPVHNHDRIHKIIDDIYTPPLGQTHVTGCHPAVKEKHHNMTSSKQESNVEFGLPFSSSADVLKVRKVKLDIEADHNLAMLQHFPAHEWKIPGAQRKLPNKGKASANLKRVQFSDVISKEKSKLGSERPADNADFLGQAETGVKKVNKASWSYAAETDSEEADHASAVHVGASQEQVSGKHHVSKQSKRGEHTEVKQHHNLSYVDYRRLLSEDTLKPTPTTKPLSAVKHHVVKERQQIASIRKLEEVPGRLPNKLHHESAGVEDTCQMGSGGSHEAAGLDQASHSLKDGGSVLDNVGYSLGGSESRPTSFKIISPQGYSKLSRQRLLSTTSSESSCSPQVESRQFPPQQQSVHQQNFHQLSAMGKTDFLPLTITTFSPRLYNKSSKAGSDDKVSDDTYGSGHYEKDSQRTFQNPPLDRQVSQSPVLRHNVIQADYELSQQMKQNGAVLLSNVDTPQPQQHEHVKPALTQARLVDHESMLMLSPYRPGSMAASEEEGISLRALTHSPSNSSINSVGSADVAVATATAMDGTFERICHLMEGNCKLTSQNEMLRRKVTKAEQQQAERFQQQHHHGLAPAPTPGAASIDSEESIAGNEQDRLSSPFSNGSFQSNSAHPSSAGWEINTSDIGIISSSQVRRNKHPSSSSVLKHLITPEQDMLTEDDPTLALPSLGNRRRHLSSGLRQPACDDSNSYQDLRMGRGSIAPASPSSFVTTKMGSPYSESVLHELLRNNIGNYYEDPLVSSSSIIRPPSQLDLFEISVNTQGSSLEANQFRHRYPSSNELKQISTSGSSMHHQGADPESSVDGLRPRNLSSSMGLHFVPDQDHMLASAAMLDSFQRQRNPSSSSIKDGGGNGNGNGNRSRNPSSSSMIRTWYLSEVLPTYGAVRSRNPSGSSNRRSRPGSSSSDRDFSILNSADDFFADISHTRSRNSSGDSNLEPSVYVPIDYQLYFPSKQYNH